MLKGKQFHGIIYSIFDGDVQGHLESPQLKVNCPKCQQRDGLRQPDGKYNLEINTEDEVFNCWKCEEPKFSGHLSKLIRLLGTKADYDLYKSYAGSYYDRFTSFEKKQDVDEVVDLTIELPREFISFHDMDNENQEHINAYMYMVNERKITKDELLKYRIGFCIEGKYAGRIIIPSYDIDGIVNYFVARSFKKQLKPPYMNPKVDKDLIVFNEGYINWDSTIYIVEGVFEMFSLVNAAPQLGKTLSKRMVSLLSERKPNVVIVLDPDAYVNAMRIFQTLSAIYGSKSERVKIVKLKGKMDLDEIRRNVGEDKVRELLRGATQLTTDDYLNQRKYSNKYEWQANRYSRADRKN